jgi:hypothetical protein
MTQNVLLAAIILTLAVFIRDCRRQYLLRRFLTYPGLAPDPRRTDDAKNLKRSLNRKQQQASRRRNRKL